MPNASTSPAIDAVTAATRRMPSRAARRIAFALVSVGIVLGGWKTASAQPAQFPPRPPAYQFDPSLNPPPEPAPEPFADPYSSPPVPPLPPGVGGRPYGPRHPYGHSIGPGVPDRFGYPHAAPPVPFGPYDPHDPHRGMDFGPPPGPHPWQEPRPRPAPPLQPLPSPRPAAPVPAAPVPPDRPAGPVLSQGDFSAFERPLLMPNHSWIYVEPVAPREIHVHDIVTIIVKEISESSVDSRFNRQRRGTLLAELREFVRFGETGNLVNAADNEPSIDGNLNTRLDATGRVVERELIVYRIAATVVDVLPNGNLVLEARKVIESNGDLWEHTLTGTIRSVDIHRDNTCLSENIANLRIVKELTGRVDDSTRRAWGVRLLDKIFPF